MFPPYIFSKAVLRVRPETNDLASDRSKAATNHPDFTLSQNSEDDAAKHRASTSHRLILVAHNTTFDQIGAAMCDGRGWIIRQEQQVVVDGIVLNVGCDNCEESLKVVYADRGTNRQLF